MTGSEDVRGVGRRTWLAGAGGLLVASSTGVVGRAFAAERGESLVASTRAGKVRGASNGSVKVFLGVRYGATTEGRRFQPPRAPDPWTDVRDATAYGAQAPQVRASNGGGLFNSWGNIQAGSEDCLFLNLWTPGLRDRARRPVMVWFHGGGFVTGSGASHAYDGARLAAKGDVVVVTVNHRLNALGYTFLPGAPSLADSGNVGNLDMVLALRWVRDNIAEFGGDPGNVLIFGESGGGAKVSTLCAMPSAAGLFHKAVVQSGSLLKARTPQTAGEDAQKLMTACGLQPGDARQLQALPVERLIEGVERSGAAFSPVVDGRSLPRHPFDPDAPAISRAVPMLIGTNKDEMTLLAGARDPTLFALTWDDLPRRLGATMKGRDVGRIVAELRRLHPSDKPSDIYFTAVTEAGMRRNAVLQAERKSASAARGGAPAYFYWMTWETPVDGGKWKTPHALDIGMVFDNVAKSASMSGTGPAQQQVADAMSGAWLRFAKTGDPGWAPYEPSRRTTMVFGERAEIVNDPRSAERRLFAPEAA